MKSEFTYKSPKSLLNKGTGYLSGYTHSLNPYTGCTFACSFCYVRQMPVSLFRKKDWGSWVDIKLEASYLLQKELQRAQKKGPVSIFMSSSTDPYQPVEGKEKVTRSLLEVMTKVPPDFLLVQTRSPLVTRDIELLKELGTRVRVSMTVETDLEKIRKHFTPSAPPIAARLRALEELKKAGIPSQGTIAPVLPSSEFFAEKLKPLVDRICIDDFLGDGSEGKRTKRLGIFSMYESLGLENWYGPKGTKIVADRFKKVFGEEKVFFGQEGFAP